MYDDEDYGADAQCIHCGCSIYFDVGIGSSNCPSCGKNYDKTDEDLLDEEEYKEEMYAKMKTPEYWLDDMASHLESADLYIEMMFTEGMVNLPKGVVEKSKWVRSELSRIIKKIKD